MERPESKDLVMRESEAAPFKARTSSAARTTR